MLLIIWGHIATLTDYVSLWASSFKVSIFFIISGMLVAKVNSNKKNVNIYEKLYKSLIIPYWKYSLIVLFVHIAVCCITSDKILSVFINDAYATLTFRGISTLWFLPSLFLGRCIYSKIDFKNKTHTVQIIIVILTLAILYLAMIPVNLIKNISDELIYKLLLYPLLTILKGGVAFFFFAVGWLSVQIPLKYKKIFCSPYFCIPLFLINIILSLNNKNVDINIYNFGDHPLLFFISSIIGSLSVIGILKFLSELVKLRFLNWIGRNSLFIMVTHLPLYITVLASKCVHVFINEQSASPLYYIQSFITVFLVVIIEYIMLQAITKIKALFKKSKLKSD